MCGRYFRRSDKQATPEHFRVRNDLYSIVLPDANYNVAPTTMRPVILESRDTKERELVLKSLQRYGFETSGSNFNRVVSWGQSDKNIAPICIGHCFAIDRAVRQDLRTQRINLMTLLHDKYGSFNPSCRVAVVISQCVGSEAAKGNHQEDHPRRPPP